MVVVVVNGCHQLYARLVAVVVEVVVIASRHVCAYVGLCTFRTLFIYAPLCGEKKIRQLWTWLLQSRTIARHKIAATWRVSGSFGV